jgi:beta-lactamase class A
MLRIAGIVAVLCAFVHAAGVEELLDAKLKAKLAALEARTTGVLGYAIIDLATGRIISHNAETVFPQASSIKIPIMMAVFAQECAGKLKLSDSFELTSRDSVGGSGHLRLLLRTRPGTLSVDELITAMIETSDNTATNRLIALVGMDQVNALIDKLRFRQTRLRRIMLDAAAGARNEENVSTPLEMARIAESIYRGKAVDADASRQMVEILKLVDADFRAVIPASVAVASKPGGLTGVRAETGIVYVSGRPFVLSVCATYLDRSDNPVREVARAVYDHFAKLARSNRFGVQRAVP